MPGMEVWVILLQRFLLIDVNPDAGDEFLVDRADKVRFDGNPAAARVDQKGGGLHLLEFLIADQACRTGVVGCVYRDHVRLRKQAVQGDGFIFLAVRGAGSGEVDDLHPEGFRDPGHLRADGAHPHDAERLAGEFGEGMSGIDMYAARTVAAVFHIFIVVEGESCEVEDVHPRDLRYGIG